LLIIAYLMLYFLETTSLNRYLFILEYVILGVLYFMLTDKQRILAPIIFIYGLPIGTLLIIHKQNYQQENETKTR